MQHKVFSIVVLTLLLIVGCQSRSARTESSGSDEFISGKVIKVIDGDTYDLLTNDNQTLRIRMEGIDAPERGMPYYKVSKNYLAELCAGKQVRFLSSGQDQYNRYLGFTYLEDGRELCYEMIKAGMAWHYKKYNSDEVLAQLEVQAREAKLGLWRDKRPMAPWTNRHLRRKGVSTKDSFDIDKSNM